MTYNIFQETDVSRDVLSLVNEPVNSHPCIPAYKVPTLLRQDIQRIAIGSNRSISFRPNILQRSLPFIKTLAEH